MDSAPFSPEPFDSRTSPEVLADLRDRLRRTRWPDAPEDAGWTHGVDLHHLRDLVDYWADGFDWSAQERRLAELPRFRVEVGGLGIHFVHARPERPAGAAAPLPLILTHGWPDSFWRYSRVIPLLVDPAAHGADPADAFDVVVPDMPGFGYSDHPSRPLDSIAVAGLWAELMQGLGYARYGAAGGDIGSHVSRYLALDHPDRVIAVHRMDAGVPSPLLDPAELTAEEREWVRGAQGWNVAEGGYMAMQRTKPQTAAVGLTDSPAGLAAWVGEKLHEWSEHDLPRDEVLTNLTIIWLTESIGSSMRMYQANAAIPPEQLARRVEVPSGFSIFPADLVRPPRAWLDRSANTVRVTEPERGGHFAPLEEPELYARELRDFFRPFRGAA